MLGINVIFLGYPRLFSNVSLGRAAFLGLFFQEIWGRKATRPNFWGNPHMVLITVTRRTSSCKNIEEIRCPQGSNRRQVQPGCSQGPLVAQPAAETLKPAVQPRAARTRGSGACHWKEHGPKWGGTCGARHHTPSPHPHKVPGPSCSLPGTLPGWDLGGSSVPQYHQATCPPLPRPTHTTHTTDSRHKHPAAATGRHQAPRVEGLPHLRVYKEITSCQNHIVGGGATWEQAFLTLN